MLHNFASLGSKNITFIIHGSSDDIKMFVIVPNNFSNYFQNTFYINYPTSEITPVAQLPAHGAKKYL